MDKQQPTLKELNAKLDEAKAKLAATKKKLAYQHAQYAKIIAHAEKHLKALQAEAPGPRRDLHAELYQLRQQLGLKGQDLVQVLSSFDPMAPNADKFMPANRPRLDQLDAEMKLVSLDYSVRNYRPVAEAIRTALRGAGGTAPTPTPPASQAARAGTGPLSANRLSGTGRLTPPGATPPARPTSGPLSQGQAGGTGPLSQPRTGGTGRLSQASAARTASGPLPQRPPSNTGRLAGGGPDLGQALSQALAQSPEQRTKLEALLAQYQEIEQALERLRGAQPGSLAVAPAETIALIGKVSGQIYYMKRTIESTGDLAALIDFEPNTGDPELQQFMAQAQMASEAGVGEAAGGDLTSKLKSFFNLG